MSSRNERKKAAGKRSSASSADGGSIPHLRTFLFVATSLAVLAYFTTYLNAWTNVLAQTQTTSDGNQLVFDNNDAAPTTEPPREARLGDGCYHVFLDVGANRGVHGRFLYEPHLYPKSVFSVGFFGREYGESRYNRDYCVFEFEANSIHWPHLQETSAAYAKMGWKYHLIEAAVSDQTGNTTFFHQGTQDSTFEEWGFSGAKNLNEEGGWEEQVPSVRLSEWIDYHIHQRIVPEFPPSVTADNTTTIDPVVTDIKAPKLGMKMDIEGFEYVVLPDMIHTGVACNFDFIFGEFHPKFAPMDQFRVDENNFHRVELGTKKQAYEYGLALQTIMQASRNCGVKWQYADDESYLHDNTPLPVPPVV